MTTVAMFLEKRQQGTIETTWKESLEIMVSGQSSTASSSDSWINDDNIYIEVQQKVDKMDRQ